LRIETAELVHSQNASAFKLEVHSVDSESIGCQKVRRPKLVQLELFQFSNRSCITTHHAIPTAQVHMANSVAIPQDIIYQVISEVGDERELLKQCALVSSSFLLPSRKQLFSEIYLRTERAAQRLRQCLIKNPIIQSFVKRIAIGPWLLDESNRLFNSSSLPTILQLQFCCLESFWISSVNYDRLDWNYFSSELKDALSNIIHSSTLETLHESHQCANYPLSRYCPSYDIAVAIHPASSF
jgi:hypothetical protein